VVSLTIAGAIAEAARMLRVAGVNEARREAGALIARALGRDRAYLITHGDEPLTPECLALLREWARRRARGEPLQYIAGRQEFYGLEFTVTPDVLIPRPETELLVETALELLQGTNAPCVCDVGTGSGCIAVALLHERKDARTIAVDLSLGALCVAARNATRHGVRERLALVASDCFDALDPAAARFHLVVSNPPYIAEIDMPGLQREVRDYEPRAALTPGGDGLAIVRRLLAETPSFLAPGGRLLFEIGHDQSERIAGCVDPRVWNLLDIREDLQGIPRVVVLGKR